MTLSELKKFIINKTVPTEFMIFVAKDCPFLASQYLQAICDMSKSGCRKINSIYEPQQSSLALLTSPEDVINILKVEVFDERAEEYSQFENTIVVCEQVSKDIAKNVENYIIKFPKLTDWQICDYAKTLCPHVEESELMWLVQASDNSIERVLNELDKEAVYEDILNFLSLN